MIAWRLLTFTHSICRNFLVLFASIGGRLEEITVNRRFLYTSKATLCLQPSLNLSTLLGLNLDTEGTRAKEEFTKDTAQEKKLLQSSFRRRFRKRIGDVVSSLSIALEKSSGKEGCYVALQEEEEA